MLQKARKKAIKFFDDYSLIVSEAKTKAKNKTKDTGFSDHRQSNLKRLTPKQMLQRLPIFLAQEKAGNTSENLLNEIRQIVYSLYRAKKQLLKKYTTTLSDQHDYKK